MKNLLLFVLLFSCVQSQKSPEGTLETFVQKRFDGAGIDDVKDYISDSYLESMNDLRETKYEKLENIKRKKFKIISKNCSSNECKITYFISYVTVDGKEKEFETETKKVASLIPGGDGWLINKIDHVKTYHDMVKDIAVEGQ